MNTASSVNKMEDNILDFVSGSSTLSILVTAASFTKLQLQSLVAS